LYNEFDTLIARPTFTPRELGLSTPAVFDPACPECLAASPHMPKPTGTPAQIAVARLVDASRAASAAKMFTNPNSTASRRFASERTWAHRQALRYAKNLAPTGELLMALTTDPATETHLYTSRAGQARWVLVRIADMLLERRHARHVPHGGFDPSPEDQRWVEAYREIVTSSSWAGLDKTQVFRILSESRSASNSCDHVAAELACLAAQLTPKPFDVVSSARRVALTVIQLVVARTSVLDGSDCF
jgi:hypothetical protein